MNKDVGYRQDNIGQHRRMIGVGNVRHTTQIGTVNPFD